MFGDRSTGEAIRSQNGKGRQGLGLADTVRSPHPSQPRSGRRYRPCVPPAPKKGQGWSARPAPGSCNFRAERQRPLPVERNTGERRTFLRSARGGSGLWVLRP